MIKNLKINTDFFKRKIVAPLLIVTTFATGAKVSEKIKQTKNDKVLSNSSILTIIDANKDNVFIDDYYNYDSNFTLHHLDETLDLYQAIDLVERCNNLDKEITKKINSYETTNDVIVSLADLSRIPNIDKLETHYFELCEQLKNTNSEDKINEIINEMQRIQIICNDYIYKQSILRFINMTIIKTQAGGLIGKEEAYIAPSFISDENKEEDKSDASILFLGSEIKDFQTVTLNKKSGVYYEALEQLWKIERGEEVGVDEFLKTAKACLATNTTISKNKELIDNGINNEVVKTLKK